MSYHEIPIPSFSPWPSTIGIDRDNMLQYDEGGGKQVFYSAAALLFSCRMAQRYNKSVMKIWWKQMRMG